MSILDRPRVKQLTQMVFGRSDINQWLFYTPSQRKFHHKVGDGSASSIVAAPLQWIGRNFPEAPPALWQKMPDSGEEERVTGMGEQGGDHLVLELLERPTPFYSGALLWMATIMDYNLSGNGYWIKIRDRVGRPIELWWTPSPMMTPIGDETTFLKRYDYEIAGQKIEIQPENVVHFRYAMDPNNPRKGRSPLAALLSEVFTDDEAAEFTATLLGNMGVPGVVISPAKGMNPTPSDIEATKEYFDGAFTGSRRGKPAVMSGATNVEQFGFNPQQMALREIRRIPEERVTAAIGIPAIVCGLGAGLDRSTFANYAEAREAAYQDNIIPSQRVLSEEVKHQLLLDFEPDAFRSFRFGFDLSNVRVLQEDRNQLAQRFDVGVRGGWIRVAEARRSQDLEVDPADEIYLRPLAVVEVPAGEAGTTPASLLSPPEPASPPVTEPPPAASAPVTDIKSFKATRLQRSLLIALTRDRIALSAAFASELSKEFDEYGAACAETFAQMVSQTSGSNGHGQKNIDVERLARLVVSSLSASTNEKLRTRFKNHILRTIEQTVNTISKVANLTGGVTDAEQKRILVAGGKRLGMVDVEKSATNTIMRLINEGNEQGMNPREIAKLIREEVPSGRYINAGSSYRSQLIARTETNWAQNSSSISYYRDADEVAMVVAMDGGDDAECAARDGQEFSFDDAEAELENEHPNGTLAFAPVVGEAVPA